jgi:hypothetical protein
MRDPSAPSKSTENQYCFLTGRTARRAAGSMGTEVFSPYHATACVTAAARSEYKQAYDRDMFRRRR